MPFVLESGVLEKHHFTTYERDAETGNDYAINREYNPTVGRFLSVDPYASGCLAKDPRTWNRYSYTRNVVVNRLDPDGLSDISPLSEGTGGGCFSSNFEGGPFPGYCLCIIAPILCSPTPGGILPDGSGTGDGAGQCTRIGISLSWSIPRSSRVKGDLATCGTFTLTVTLYNVPNGVTTDGPPTISSPTYDNAFRQFGAAPTQKTEGNRITWSGVYQVGNVLDYNVTTNVGIRAVVGIDGLTDPNGDLVLCVKDSTQQGHSGNYLAVRGAIPPPSHSGFKDCNDPGN
jgi:RHS repeat-associated protein